MQRWPKTNRFNIYPISGISCNGNYAPGKPQHPRTESNIPEQNLSKFNTQMKKALHILQLGASVEEIVNIAAVAVVDAQQKEI